MSRKGKYGQAILGSVPSSGVTQEVLCHFLEGEQDQSGMTAWRLIAQLRSSTMNTDR